MSTAIIASEVSSGSIEAPPESVLNLSILASLTPAEGDEEGDFLGTTKNCSHRCGC
jgi:hypothetical protein